MERFRVALRAAVYVTVFVLAWWWLAVHVQYFDRFLGFRFVAGVEWAGMVCLALGAAIAFSCVALFIVRGRGTPAIVDAPRVLVAQGPYCYVRNPMCIGGFFMLAGLALLHRSPSMLVFALVVLYGVHLFIVWFEEPGLVKRFGDSYVAYRDSVNRWVPKLPSGSLRVK